MTRALGTTCVALHGFLGRAEDWSAAFTPLAKPAIAVALPGHQEATPSLFTAGERAALMRSPTIDHWADGLAASLRQSGPLATPIDLMGYSLGGRVAIALADRHPELVRRLVVVSASLGIEGSAERAARVTTDDARAQELAACDREQLREWLGRWYDAPLFATLSQEPALLRAAIDTRSRNDAAAMAKVVAGLSPGRAPFRGLWADTTPVPTLWIAGSNDERYAEGAQQAARRMRNASVHLVAGGGHALLTTHPDEVGQAASWWLSR